MIESLQEVLTQGETLLLSLDDETFTTKVPLADHSTIGAHYRHTLEHIRSLLDGLESVEIDYDARKRDPLIESNRDVALLETRELVARSSSLEKLDLEDPIKARCKVSYADEDSMVADSTVGREAMFCISHAIHHYALIAIMARFLQVTLPTGFGVAPSTIKYQRSMMQTS